MAILLKLKERDYKLDITCLKDDSLEDGNELPEPQDLAIEAITELVDDLREIIRLIEWEKGWSYIFQLEDFGKKYYHLAKR